MEEEQKVWFPYDITPEELKQLDDDYNNNIRLKHRQKQIKKYLDKHQYYNPKETIHKPSQCDVFRNNKYFLIDLITKFKYEVLSKEEVKKELNAETLEESDKLFEESNDRLPTNWYNKLKKLYQPLREVFNS